ncbi:flagellar protein FlaG [Photobacterium rosenbergii]|uniref:Flagellar protein FlaG n=1 Tax=Photobacterium rosenbergii TaxID=294936 RepID=A0ABU3ZLZ3_9GAMM|nr:flagellar protein FlaG [Photobacterium rosenbergii]MDV5171131.1 flagellar protein FlaG [Photobacterium rosenbergii]
MDKLSDNPAASSISKAATVHTKPTLLPNELGSSKHTNAAQTELPLNSTVTQIEKVDNSRLKHESSADELNEFHREQIEALSQRINRELKFEFDEEHGEQVVYIYDKTSGDLIRQIPAQELLDLNENLSKYSVSSFQEKI